MRPQVRAVVLGVIGLLMAAGAMAQERVQLVRAEYGADTRWIDVTDRVRSLIEGDMLRIKVNDSNMGSNPALGASKTLRLYVRGARGQAQTLSYEEGQHIEVRIVSGAPGLFPGQGGGVGGDGLALLRAEYGADTRWADVTDRVRGLIEGDVLRIKVNDTNMGGNPAGGASKTLRLYVRDAHGQAQTLSYEEGQHIEVRIVSRAPGFFPGQRGGYGGYGTALLRAEYGADTRWADVTARVRSLIEGDVLRIKVNDTNMGGNPAGGASKTLRLYVRDAHGQTQTLSYAEGQHIEVRIVSNESSNLRILRAEYGSNGRVWDVTARLNSRIQNDVLNLAVENRNMGGDPDDDHRKQLDVWYVHNGRQAHVTVPEHGTLNLPGGTDYYEGRLRVTRAQYGAGNRFADVTERVNSLVRGDRLEFRVTDSALGGDPARDERKVLTILYVFDGQSGRAFANEGDTVSVPDSGMGGMPGSHGPINPPRPGIWWPGSGNYQDLQILEASYGAGERRTDVTSRLSSLVRDGSLELRVTDDAMGVDPARGEMKRLRVIYLWQGLRYQTNVPQGETLSIP